MWNGHCFAVRHEIALAIARLVHFDFSLWLSYLIADINFILFCLLFCLMNGILLLFFLFGFTAGRDEAALATLLTTCTVHTTANADRQDDEGQESDEDESESP